MTAHSWRVNPGSPTRGVECELRKKAEIQRFKKIPPRAFWKERKSKTRGIILGKVEKMGVLIFHFFSSWTHLFHEFFEGFEVEVLLEVAHLSDEERRVQRGPRNGHAAFVVAQAKK